MKHEQDDIQPQMVLLSRSSEAYDPESNGGVMNNV